MGSLMTVFTMLKVRKKILIVAITFHSVYRFWVNNWYFSTTQETFPPSSLTGPVTTILLTIFLKNQVKL